jgi:hypothetical protein
MDTFITVILFFGYGIILLLALLHEARALITVPSLRLYSYGDCEMYRVRELLGRPYPPGPDQP